MRKLLAKPRRTSFAFRLHSFTLASAIISAVAAPTPENEPHDVRVTEHHGVRMLSDEVPHCAVARDGACGWCDSVPNTPALDTKGLSGGRRLAANVPAGRTEGALIADDSAMWSGGPSLTSSDVENPARHAGEHSVQRGAPLAHRPEDEHGAHSLHAYA